MKATQFIRAIKQTECFNSTHLKKKITKTNQRINLTKEATDFSNEIFLCSYTDN